MAHTKKHLRKSQRRRHSGSKRRGQYGGSLAPLSPSEVTGADTAGAGANMLKLVGDGPTQTVSAHGSIEVHKAQAGGSARRRKHRKLRGGSLMDALSSAIVPLALFGMQNRYGRKTHKKR